MILLDMSGSELNLSKPIKIHNAERLVKKLYVKQVDKNTLQIICPKYQEERIRNIEAIEKNIKERETHEWESFCEELGYEPQMHVGNGWNHISGMSNNAVTAYCNGKVPISRVTRKLLNEYGISITIKEAKEKLFEIGSCEYHHTSKFANKTEFYDLNELKQHIEHTTDKTQNEKS